jgi:predicted GNAT superfamily acetyltransferase
MHASIEIPANLAHLKSRAPSEAAREWQAAVRQAFQTAFEAGFEAVGFSREDPEHPRYLLERSA